MYAICQGCGKELEENEVDQYSGGLCHAVAVWDARYEEFEREPCGPIKIIDEHKEGCRGNNRQYPNTNAG